MSRQEPMAPGTKECASSATPIGSFLARPSRQWHPLPICTTVTNPIDTKVPSLTGPFTTVSTSRTESARTTPSHTRRCRAARKKGDTAKYPSLSPFMHTHPGGTLPVGRESPRRCPKRAPVKKTPSYSRPLLNILILITLYAGTQHHH